MLGSANRDNQAFAEADQFQISRKTGGSLAFGGGPHICAGMWAARWAVANVAMPMLYRRFTGLRTVPDHLGVWEGFIFRGLTSLPVTWDKDNGGDG